MTLHLPELYHWAPATVRPQITRRGLKPTTPTAVWVRPDRPGELKGHATSDLPDQSILCVCLGTTPSTAWALSGCWSSSPGEVWDLWEVHVTTEDEVHYRPSLGTDLDEVRVANRIPRSRVWLVGSRTRGRQRWSHA